MLTVCLFDGLVSKSELISLFNKKLLIYDKFRSVAIGKNLDQFEIIRGFDCENTVLEHIVNTNDYTPNNVNIYPSMKVETTDKHTITSSHKIESLIDNDEYNTDNSSNNNVSQNSNYKIATKPRRRTGILRLSSIDVLSKPNCNEKNEYDKDTMNDKCSLPTIRKYIQDKTNFYQNRRFDDLKNKPLWRAYLFQFVNASPNPISAIIFQIHNNLCNEFATQTIIYQSIASGNCNSNLINYRRSKSSAIIDSRLLHDCNNKYNYNSGDRYDYYYTRYSDNLDIKQFSRNYNNLVCDCIDLLKQSEISIPLVYNYTVDCGDDNDDVLLSQKIKPIARNGLTTRIEATIKLVWKLVLLLYGFGVFLLKYTKWLLKSEKTT